MQVIKKTIKRIIGEVSQNKENSTRIPIIKKSEALKALQSINRNPLPAFSYFKRLPTTTNEIDDLEERWWNAAGNLIEDIWGLTDDLCLAYREEYVLKAKSFFLQDKKNVRVLDLGCGTGWFGRIIADENIFYHGIDFSETQITIALQKAKGIVNEKFLSYSQTKDLKSVKDLQDFDGIIINAFLHHLCKDELIDLFDNIKDNFKAGTKIFIMEPAYPTNKPIHTKSTIDNINADIILSIIQVVKNQAIQNQIFDLKKEQELIALINESSSNGFFFSPKEVPFEFEELEDLLAKYALPQNYYYVGMHDFAFLQMLAYVHDEAFIKEVIKEIFPTIKLMDKQLIDNSFYFNGTSSYLFTCFEYELR